MATARHAALDGSEVTLAADADMSFPMTAFGFVRPRGMRTPQPLNIFPPGKSERLLADAPTAFADVDYDIVGETDVHGGLLRMARIRRPTATGGTRELTYGIWEGTSGSISTSVRGDRAAMEDLFGRLRFRQVARGIAVDSPVDESIRPLRCLKQVGPALVEVRPLTSTVRRGLPRSAGRRVPAGEMFRRTASSRDVLVVTDTAAVYVAPTGTADDHVDVAAELAVTWGPRA
jgi:hypothetical protein